MSRSSIAVVGWPRSGTAWLQKLLEDSLDMKVDKPHALPVNPSDRKYVFTTRDPRDALVSVYFFHLHHHGELLGQTRDNLTILEYMKRYFMIGGKYMGNLNCGWAEYHKQWISLIMSNTDIVVTCHEGLMANRKYQLSRTLERLKTPIDEKRLEFAIKNSLNQHRPSYTRPETQVPAGMAGEWRGCLDNGTLTFLENYCGSIMHRLGYRLETK